VFAFIHVGKVNFELSCFDDYLGGYFFPGIKKAAAQMDGDEGDSWESQAMLFFSEKSSGLLLWIETWASSDGAINCDLQALDSQAMKQCKQKSKVTCSHEQKFYAWDLEAKTFKATEYKGDKPRRELMPFEFYLKNCGVHTP